MNSMNIETRVATRLADLLGQSWMQSDIITEARETALIEKRSLMDSIMYEINFYRSEQTRARENNNNREYVRKVVKANEDEIVKLEAELEHYMAKHEYKVETNSEKIGAVVFDAHGNIIEVCGLRDE